MKKTHSIIIGAIILANSFSTLAQTSPKQEIKSCSEQLIMSKAKTEQGINVTSAGGFLASVGGGFLAASLGTGPALPITIFGGAVVGTTVLAIKFTEKKHALEIFEGAANGGNSRTEKLWRKANKKHPETFKKITYAEFLASIHKADLNGEACRVDNSPSKKAFIKIVEVDISENSNKQVGQVSNKKIDDSERGSEKQIANEPNTESGKINQVQVE